MDQWTFYEGINLTFPCPLVIASQGGSWFLLCIPLFWMTMDISFNPQTFGKFGTLRLLFYLFGSGPWLDGLAV